MKNLTKPILILLFSYSLFFNQAFGQRNISVFNTPVNLDAPVTRQEIAAGYPESIGASHLRLCGAYDLSPSDLIEIYSAVNNSLIQPGSPKGNPVLGAFFTTEYGADTLTIVKSKTHGVCFGFHTDSTLTIYYYEVNASGNYERVENLTTKINSASDDLYMALHYSHFAPGSYPDQSTIFRFVCDSIGKIGTGITSDITVELGKDHKRVTGLYPIGMADSLILIDCQALNIEPGNCTSPCLGARPKSVCTMLVDFLGFTVYTCLNERGGCAVGNVERRAQQENITLSVPIKYKMMRDFRDQFMTNYCEGRKYAGFYYLFSKYAKMSVSMLWKYSAVLPELYDAMNNLTDLNSDNIIVTTSLKDKVIDILKDHKDVGDAYFQSILSEVENDMIAYEGMTRSKLTARLTPYGQCANHRLSASDEDDSYYVNVFNNPSHDEIVVSYSLSGTKIKFELFSSTGGVVATINNTSPKQRVNLSTMKLTPGVYLYRITSDSGYEKRGKVVLMK